MSTKSTSTKKVAASKDKKVSTPAVVPKEKKSTKKVESKEADPDVSTDKKERKRREVNKETVDAVFGEIQARIEAEITKLRESTEKVRGIKFLRSINKSIKTLHSDTKRVMKLKKKNNRKKTVVSGFLKPVKITPELAAFTGWDITSTYSRVDVTKFICQYIKTNSLYDTADKRLILCDDKLKVLLKYDPANPPVDEKGVSCPLNYFRLQRHLKPHFIKIETMKETEATPATKTTTTKKAAVPAKKAPVAAKKSAKKVQEAEEDVEDEEIED